jgi:hypothetical protein
MKVAYFSESLILRPTVSRPVCLGIKYPSGAYDQICITIRQLRVCWCGAHSLTRGRICRLQLLLALGSAVIFGAESSGTIDHVLLSQIRDFPFCRLLRLGGLRWRYLNPPSHGITLSCLNSRLLSFQYMLWFDTTRTSQKIPRPAVHIFFMCICFAGTFDKPLSSNDRLFWLHCSCF